MTTKLFIYGTLKSGGALHHHLKQLNAKLITIDQLDGYLMFMSPSFYPFVVQGDGTITGEVWEIKQEGVERLDWVEGAPSLFVREKAVTKQGYQVEVYVGKEFNEYRYEPIISGEWEITNNQ